MPLTLHYLFIVHACGLLHTNCLYVFGMSMAVRDVYYFSLLYIAMCHLLLSPMCWYFFVVFAEDKKKKLLLPPKTARHCVGVQELRVF